MGGRVSRLEMVLDEHGGGQHELRPLPAGSLLRGKIVVELNKPVRITGSNNANNALEVRLYGKEKVHMNRRKSIVTHGTAPSGWGSPRKDAERNLLDLKLQWPQFPGGDDTAESSTRSTIPAGLYVFPFAVQLPPSLPSSTYHPRCDGRKRDRLRFRIQYKLVATLDPCLFGGGTVSTKTTIKRYLWIAAAQPNPPLPVAPCLLEPVAHVVQPATSGGFFGRSQKQGTLLIGAAVENCNLQAEQFLHLHVACRNDSSIDIRCVHVQILERLDWATSKAGSNNRENDNNTRIDPTTGQAYTLTSLRQTEFVPVMTLPSVQLPGLAKERSPSKGLLKSVVQSIFGHESLSEQQQQQQQLQRKVYEDLVSGGNLLRIQLPDTVRESYSGQLIQVRHLVRIEFQSTMATSGGGGQSTAGALPVVEVPLYVSGHAVAPLLGNSNESSGAGEAYRVPTETATTGVDSDVKFGGDGTAASKCDSPIAVGAEPVATFLSEREDNNSKKKTTQQQANEIPIAQAVAIPNSAVEASTIVTGDVVVLGGDAVLREQSWRRVGNNNNNAATSLSDLVPLAPPPSLPTLLYEMNSCISALQLLLEKLRDPQWTQVFQSLSSDDFGKLVSRVEPALDQPRAGQLLAPHLNGGRGMQCDDLAAALRACGTSPHRALMTQRLLPFCTDAAQNHDRVRVELNEWEQTVAGDVLAEVAR